MIPTKEETIKHLKEGVGENCLVCKEKLIGSWTDYNGEIKCSNCGMTYQIRGCHLKQEALDKYGLTKEMVAKKYCGEFKLINICRDYWNETKDEIPFGWFMPGSSQQHGRCSQEAWRDFNKWLLKNADKYEEEYEEWFLWDEMRKRYIGGEN